LKLPTERRKPALFIAGGVFAAILFCSPPSSIAQTKAAEPQPQPAVVIPPKDISDVIIRTGPELAGLVDRLMGQDKNVKAAAVFFQEQKKLRLAPDGFTEVRFKRISTSERVSVVVISYAEASANPEALNIVVWAEKSPKQSAPTVVRVYAAVGTAGKEPPSVKEDYQFIDGKPDPTKGRLKEWIKCSLVGCAAAAAGCALGGPGWPACFSAWCGAGAFGCWLIQLF
jgi:hypothetical protein